ncbi:MAG: D-sedoheptulose 7-phosphate isomerase [Chloroflexi bacterium]|nr:D-sedoheptulose 7-phosphate isomerase [Chloroflexota bacterium]
MRREIEVRLEESARLKLAIASSLSADIERFVSLVISAYKAGGKLVLLGNGGSAADAQHLAAEFVGHFKLERQAFPAIALTTNTSTLTAIANDYGYDMVFARQVEALVNKSDVVVGISTSGNSSNVIQALKTARGIGATTIGLTGGAGGRLGEVADLLISVPSGDTPRIQEAHITIGHIVCELVEREMAGGD